MRYPFTLITLLLLTGKLSAQLGFCPGSKGDPIFTENFGNGTTYGPALAPGITSYVFVNGAPNDGQYSLYYHSSLYSTWHYSLDHTPDATNGANGKMLLMNANAVTSGDFYKKTVSGLCVNTTFEFSAWVLNVYNPNSGFCGAGEIPINVRFEIWNEDETELLGSGNTGNIIGTPTPLWQQFALVFTTTDQTSVVLKMKNNGLGGCGNDLAIDDISFSSCGDLTTVSSPSVSGTSYSTCDSPASIALQAATAGGSAYVYQWQSSTDGILWNDMAGETNPVLSASGITSDVFFRVKAAQDAANLANSYCSSLSNVFSVAILPAPDPPGGTLNYMICSNETPPALTVTSESGTEVNWYNSATGGTLLQANSLTFIPPGPGIFYAEAVNPVTNCISLTRTPVSLTVVTQPAATLSGPASICSGSIANILISGTPEATVTYRINEGPNMTVQLSTSGTATLSSSPLTSDSTYTLVSVSSAEMTSCQAALNESFTIEVGSQPVAVLSGPAAICSGDSATLLLTGTPNATVSYSIDGGSTQTIILNPSGEATLSTSNLTSSVTYNLIEVSVTGVSNCSQLLSQSLTINISSLPTASFSASESSVCGGQSVILEFTGSPNAVVSFTKDSGPLLTVVLDNSGTATYQTAGLAAATIFQLSQVSLPGGGCGQALSDSLTVSILPTPTTDFNGITQYCSGNTISLALIADVPGTQFSWTVTASGVGGASAGTGNLISDTLTLDQNTPGTVIYEIIPSLSGCNGEPIEITIEVLPAPVPAISDGVICLTASADPATQVYLLDTQLDETGHSFQWFFEYSPIPGATQSTYAASQIGTYSVMATNAAGCVSDLVYAEVTERPQGESLIITQPQGFHSEATIEIQVVGSGGPYVYSLDGQISQSSNIFYGVPAGTHTVMVTDEYCTQLWTSFTIMDYPKFFTPNQDGFHDTWNIEGITGGNVWIFDRYGKLLRQLSTNGPGWDGTYHGKVMPSADYWFVIEYQMNGRTENFKAHFALKR